MERFDFSLYLNPMDYRYTPQDKQLKKKILEYKNLDIFTKLSRIVPESVVPRLSSLEKELLEIARKNKGRIHRRIDGEHNGMVTVKEVFNDYAKRLAGRNKDIQKLPLNLNKLKEPVRNDRISDLVYFSLSAFSVEANIANDIRHQFRTEIGEYERASGYQVDIVGSSTMPHKINPVEYEKIVSLCKAYLPRVTSSLMSQITEHQGDSTNEYNPYFSFEMVCALSYSTQNLKQSLKNLKINVV